MKKIIYLITLIAILTTTGCQSLQTTANQAPRETRPDLSAEIAAMNLSADLVVPATLPSHVQEPVLLEGWIRLYNSTKTCQLWDGKTLTGQQLAQYALDNNVSISWNTDPAYGESSWVDRGGTENVYINPGLQKQTQTQMVSLVGTMAHEMFHRTNPFDQIEDTLYEEYWAFYVGSCVSGRVNADYIHYNPLSASSLKNWFEDNKRSSYLGEFDTYPASVVVMTIPEK